MPRFFFHVQDVSLRADHIGTDLPDVGSARAEALKLAGEILKDAGLKADLGECWRIDVMNHLGATLFRMEFKVAKNPDMSCEMDMRDIVCRS